MRIHILGAAAVLVVGLVSSALAADLPTKAPYMKAPPIAGCGYGPIQLANSQISIQYAGTNVNYREFNPANPLFTDPALPVGGFLDGERGWVHGGSITASTMFNLGAICDVYAFARGSYFDGQTDYSQPLGRLGGRSDARIWEGDFRLGKGFSLASDWMITPYIGGGTRSWDRDLCQGGACFGFGFHERYTHGYVGGGLLLQWAATRDLVFSGSGLVGSTVSPEISGGPLANGNRTVPNFRGDLGTSAIYKLEGSVDYAFTQNFHGNVGVEYTNWKYGQSAQFASFAAIEPTSRTETVTVRAGLGYAFGAPVVAKY